MNTITELNQKVAEYRSMKALIDEATKALEEVKGEIKNFLLDNQIEEFIGNDYKITLTQVNRMNWDTTKLNDLLGDEAEDFKKASPYSKLSVN